MIGPGPGNLIGLLRFGETPDKEVEVLLDQMIYRGSVGFIPVWLGKNNGPAVLVVLPPAGVTIKCDGVRETGAFFLRDGRRMTVSGEANFEAEFVAAELVLSEGGWGSYCVFCRRPMDRVIAVIRNGRRPGSFTGVPLCRECDLALHKSRNHGPFDENGREIP